MVDHTGDSESRKGKDQSSLQTKPQRYYSGLRAIWTSTGSVVGIVDQSGVIFSLLSQERFKDPATCQQAINTGNWNPEDSIEAAIEPVLMLMRTGALIKDTALRERADADIVAAMENVDFGPLA